MHYLPIHPRRALRVGDDVIHVGEGSTYRGKLGRVVMVYGSKSCGQVKILWDHRQSPMEYSIGWCLRMLGVHVNCLRVNYQDFHGKTYVDKYLHWAFSKHDVVKGFFLTPHHTMKAQEDEKLRAEEQCRVQHCEVDVMSDYQRALMAQLKLDWSILQHPGLYKLIPTTDGLGYRVEAIPAKPAQPVQEKPVSKVVFPVIAESRKNGRIIHIASEAELQKLGVGSYTLYSKSCNIAVAPVQQKEITFL